jgi:hypothetical protein
VLQLRARGDIALLIVAADLQAEIRRRLRELD